MVNYKVGDIIEEQAGGAPLRKVRVTQKKRNIKRGVPGFHGIEVTLDPYGNYVDVPTLPGCGVWGYDTSVIRLLDTLPEMDPDIERAYTASLNLARGSYQRALIRGEQRWSGSDLKGDAKHYGMIYARSRRRLLERLMRDGAGWIEKNEHGHLKLRHGKIPRNYIQTHCAAGVAFKKGLPGPETYKPVFCSVGEKLRDSLLVS